MAKTLPMIANFDDIPAEALVPAAEQPYKIPAHWKWVWFGSVANFIGGGTPDKSVSSFWDGEILWASVKDLRHPRITRTIDTITEEGLANSATSLCDVGDLVLATRIMPGKSAIATVPIAINQDLKIVKTQLLVPEYLQYYLDSQTCWFESNSSGSTVKGIRISSLASLPVPLAPLDVQHGIVRRVEQANAKIDDVIERLRQHLEQAPNLRAKFIQAGVAGRLTPSWRREQNLSGGSWRRTTVGELGTVVTGNTPPTKVKENYGDFLPFIKPADLNQGRRINLADSSLSETGAKLARVVPPGSVAMCCIGATITKAGLIDVEAATNQQINVLVPSTDHDSVFLFYLFESPQFKHEVIASSSSTTLPIINKGRFSKLEVEVPELLEQQEIARILDKALGEFDQTVELIESTIAKLLLLRSHYVLSALAGN